MNFQLTEFTFFHTQELSSDVEALIYEIADKHDQISRLRDRLRDSEQEIVSLESKIKFRENIIRELRTEKKKSKSHEVSIFPSFFYVSATILLKIPH